MSLLAKCVAGVAFVAIGAASASADIVITPGPGNFPGDEEVLFNRDFLADNGPLVQGITNQNQFIVDFFGAGEDLFTPALGQARIEAVDGAFTQMTIALNTAGATFTTLIFNLDVLNGAGDGNVTINVVEPNAEVTSGTFAVDENGENFFMIQAINGQSIASVNFVSTVPVTAFADLQQVRIGGISGAEAIPLPAAALSGGLMLAVGAIARRIRGQKA